MLRGLRNKGMEMQQKVAEGLAGISIGSAAVGHWLGPATEYLGFAAIVISIVAGSLSIWLRWIKIKEARSKDS